MRVPQFFVIGAQKCGTTTLYEDLRLHPDVLLPEKESRTLLGGPASREELLDRLPREVRSAGDGVVVGEVSTRYAMLPDDPDAPANAALLTPEARIIYIVRDPLDRVVSHHHHDFGLGFVGPDIDEAVRSYPSLVANTRYATQVEPWLEQFGRERIEVVRFESYMADRVAGLAGLVDHIGAAALPLDPGDEAHNAAGTKHIASGRWGAVARNPVYRKVLRPLLGEQMRRRINRRVLPKAPPRPDAPSEATLRMLAETLAPEVTRLATLLGTEEFWDVEASLARHLAAAE